MTKCWLSAPHIDGISSFAYLLLDCMNRTVNSRICICLDLIRDIRDPEKPETLEQLHIVCEDGVKVKPLNSKTCVISVEFSPTVQHCSLASLIGLCCILCRYNVTV